MGVKQLEEKNTTGLLGYRIYSFELEAGADPGAS